MTAETQATIERIRLGRKGSMTTDGHIRLEVQAFASNHPVVELVLGVETNGHFRTQTITPNASQRSGGGNGEDRYQVEAGLYRIRDILTTGSRKLTSIVALGTNVIRELDGDEKAEDLNARFPSDMKLLHAHNRMRREQAQLAETIRAEIAEERAALAAPTRVDDLVAIPEFQELPTIEEVVEAMSQDSFERDSYIMSRSAPVHFIVQQPCFAKAKTPTLAIAAALAKIKEREIQLVEAQNQAVGAGWPELTGSSKQIAWAETIRTKVAAKDPNLKALKTASTAKYWIDNHRMVR